MRDFRRQREELAAAAGLASPPSPAPIQPTSGDGPAPMPVKFALDDAFARIAEPWRPRVAAELNGQELKLVKVEGVFPWHRHEAEDELFLVWKGALRIEFRDGAVELRAGEALVVPRGVEHRPVADAPAEILLFEPAGVRNTGDVVDSEFTAPTGVRI